MSEAISITSSNKLDNIEHSFRVFAGPGAGKTYWLKNHIENVIRNSEKLNSVSKIACITYTIIASEQIKERLGKSTDKVEVSTIHSFLYKNIVKPYAFLLKRDDGTNLINIDKLDGHDEHVPSVGKILEWTKECKLNYLSTHCGNKVLHDCLSNLTWKLSSDLREVDLAMRDYHKYNTRLEKLCKYNFPMKSAFDYKLKCWQDGQIHHEDVLYFSYQILHENPRISVFLKHKFPYIFLDEFQDTNPIQTQIVKILANEGCIVGIIGDTAQSIYKFQGAERKDFLDFQLDGLIDYKIEGNRRSTCNIVNLLKHMRRNDEIQQKCLRNVMGSEVTIIVSNQLSFVNQIISADFCKIGFDGEHCTLARSNKSVAILKSGVQSCNNNVWEEFEDVDYKRKNFYYRLFVAMEYAFQGQYALASKQLLRIFRTDTNGNLKYNLKGTINSTLMQKESIVICFLQQILECHALILESNLYEINNDILYPFLSTNFNIQLPKLVKGKAKDFCESVLGKNLVQSLKLHEDTTLIRTIHKAKAAEFGSVYVYLNSEDDLKCILAPNLDENEEHRIFYVAFSRAKDHLYISTPFMSSANEEIIKNLDLNIRIISENYQ